MKEESGKSLEYAANLKHAKKAECYLVRPHAPLSRHPAISLVNIRYSPVTCCFEVTAQNLLVAGPSNARRLVSVGSKVR